MNMKSPLFVAFALVFLVSVSIAAAQNFSGSYTGRTEEGNLTLQLQQSGTNVSGALTAWGTTLQISGRVEGGRVTAVGKMTEAPVQFFITVTNTGGQTVLEVMEEGENHQPDMATKERYILVRQGGGPASFESQHQAYSAPSMESLSSASYPGIGNPLAPGADAVSGTYKNQDMTVEIQAAASGFYQGRISFSGNVFPFTAKGNQAAGLSGTFRSGGDNYEFTASFANGAMELSTGGATHTLPKEGLPAAKPNPLAGSRGPTNPLAGPGRNGVPSIPGGLNDWKVLSHPVGIDVRYPPTWTVNRLEGAFFQMIPPNPGSENQQPTETYFLGGAQAGAITRPDDPQLLQLLGSQVLQLAPFLVQAGGVEQVRAGDQPGASVAWEGQNQLGKSIGARMYVTIIKGFAVCLLEIGYKDRIAARDPEFRQIFASLGGRQASQDPMVAGSWFLRETRSGGASHAMQNTSSASENRAQLILQPGGLARRSETYQFMGNSQIKNSGGEHTSTVYIDSGPQTTVKNGRWVAGDGRLVLLWDDESGDEYNYQVQGMAGGRTLALTTEKGSVQIWGESR